MRVFKCFPHLAGVMQDAPGINNVEFPERTHVIAIECRTLFDDPVIVVRIVPLSEFSSAGDRLRIVIEGMYRSSESTGRQTRKTATGTDVEKSFSSQVRNLEHLPDGPF